MERIWWELISGQSFCPISPLELVLVLGIGGHSSGKFWVVKSWDFIMNKGKLESKSYLPLFETRPARGRQLFQLFSASISITICFIWVYRVSYFPAAEAKAERWTWLGLFLAELWFSLEVLMGRFGPGPEKILAWVLGLGFTRPEIWT
ncbi:hypothetical protein Goari_014677 [Gossypium aridum]|uniref:Uncharacterized protein n=1 Tax=Gossypium aridum TaxID=34290 RepID=A0A7J8XIH8_GOSAI|nr:hypothetical protein [Gossypium aridum]